MMRNLIYIACASIVLCANSQAALAQCNDISSQMVQPLEFGLMRYDNGFTRGTASIWPNGFVHLPRGLSMSSSANAHPAIIRIDGAQASEIALRIDLDIIDGKDIGEISNIRVSVIGADFEYDGTILRIINRDYKASHNLNITILLGGDLNISIKNYTHGLFMANMKIRCLYQV